MEMVAVTYNSTVIPVALGREIRKNLGRWEKRHNMPPQYFIIRMLKKDSSLVRLISQDLHNRGHNTSPNYLMKSSIREGFLWSGCEDTFKKLNSACVWCKYKRTSFRKLVQSQAILGPDSTLEHLTSEHLLDVVIIDETGPYTLATGLGSFYLLMVVELTTRRVHLIPIERMNTTSVIRGLQILSSRRGGWKIIVADHHKTHKSLSSDSTMAKTDDLGEPTDLQGFMKKEEVQEAAERMGMRFKLVSGKSHHSVGLAEDVSRRIKLLMYDTYKDKCLNIFDAFSRAATIEEQINDRIIAICPDGSVLTPNSFGYAAGLHSNMPARDITGMSSSENPTIIARLEDLRRRTADTIKDYTNHYVKHLLSFTDRKFKVESIRKGDIVAVLDRVKSKQHDPDSHALGRVLEASDGERQFSVEMVRPSPRRPPLIRKKNPGEVLSRPRKSLVLLLRADENLNSPVWVDPWVGISNQEILNFKYNPLKVKFKNELQKLPPKANLPVLDIQPATKLTLQHSEPLETIQDLPRATTTTPTQIKDKPGACSLVLRHSEPVETIKDLPRVTDITRPVLKEKESVTKEKEIVRPTIEIRRSQRIKRKSPDT
jgi:hypothetical protein